MYLFSEVFSQMPTYSKFLKDTFSKEQKLEDGETVALTTEYNALLQNKLSPNLEGLESFSIRDLWPQMHNNAK